jgi:putative MFS transporter
VVLRAVAGFFLGAEIVTGYSYLSEFTAARDRGRFQAWMGVITNSGSLCAATAAYLIIPRFDPTLGWRVYIALFIVPAIVACFGPKFLPESPRWLLSVGREKEAVMVVERFEAEAREKGKALPEPQLMPPPIRQLGAKALLSPGVRRRFGVTVTSQGIHLTCIFFYLSFLPTFLIATGIPMLSAFLFTAIGYVGSFLGPLVATFLADRFERKWLTCAAAILNAVTAIALSLQRSELAIVGLTILMTSGIYFISSTSVAYVPEILPTAVRMRGMGISMLVGRLGAAMMPLYIVHIMSGLGGNVLSLLAIPGGLYAVMAIVLGIFGPKSTGIALESLSERLTKSAN